jgi:hypothetical protein
MRSCISPSAIYLVEDYARFRQLHSWYKHIPLYGQDFYVYEKPENGWHWRFHWKPPENGSEYIKVRFGPFLRGMATTNLNIILTKAGDSFAPWLMEHYPHLVGLDLSDSWLATERDNLVLELYRGECEKYARQLAEGFRELTGEELPWTEYDFVSQYHEPV